MNESLTPLVLSLLAGIAVGALFFGGLWWTSKKILAPGQPALWFIGSFLVRMSVTLAVFYVVAQGDWQRLLVCRLASCPLQDSPRATEKSMASTALKVLDRDCWTSSTNRMLG